MRVPDPDRRNLLEGKVCLITGGGGSLGRATARLFLKEGARVVLADRNPDALTAAQAALDDVNVSVIGGDVTVEADVARAMDAVVDRHGALDVLVANAGTPAAIAPVTEFDVDEFDRTLAVHVRGVFLACKHGLRVLADGGSVVIVSGVAGLRADAGTSACRGRRARPGGADAVGGQGGGGPPHPGQHHPPGADGQRLPGRHRGAADAGPGHRCDGVLRRADPAGAARAARGDRGSVLYLASAQSSFTTGSTLVVDGGMSG